MATATATKTAKGAMLMKAMKAMRTTRAMRAMKAMMDMMDTMDMGTTIVLTRLTTTPPPATVFEMICGRAGKSTKARLNQSKGESPPGATRRIE